MLKIIYNTIYYIVDAGIYSELICSRLWKVSQFYTPDSQILWYNKKKIKKSQIFNINGGNISDVR